MAHNKTERAIALAGVYQAASLVALIANKKPVDVHYLEASIASIFNTSPKDTLDVFGGDLANLRLGLTQLASDKQNEDITRYVISLLAVDTQLNKRPDMLADIGRRLQHVQTGLAFSDNPNDKFNRLSGVYQDTLSTLAFRIQVVGDREHLTQTANSDKIRSLLLAGVRAARLWRQVGGSKWQFIFARGSIEKLSKQLLNQLSSVN